jgi:hypothetical protein
MKSCFSAIRENSGKDIVPACFYYSFAMIFSKLGTKKAGQLPGL